MTGHNAAVSQCTPWVLCPCWKCVSWFGAAVCLVVRFILSPRGALGFYPTVAWSVASNQRAGAQRGCEHATSNNTGNQLGGWLGSPT